MTDPAEEGGEASSVLHIYICVTRSRVIYGTDIGAGKSYKAPANPHRQKICRSGVQKSRTHDGIIFLRQVVTKNMIDVREKQINGATKETAITATTIPPIPMQHIVKADGQR